MKECSNFIDLQWDYSAFPAPLGEETVFFSWWSDAKEIACKTGNPALVPGLGRSPGERNGYPLQYSCLGNPMDRGLRGLQSMGSQRVGHDWVTNTFTFIVSSCLMCWGLIDHRCVDLFLGSLFCSFHLYVCFVTVQYYFHCCSFVWFSELRKLDNSSSIFFFPSILFWLFGNFLFLYRFLNYLLYYSEKCHCYLLGITLNL